MKWSRSSFEKAINGRYAVIRRSAMNPIFHPYFINYGYNKEELLNRLISLSMFFSIIVIISSRI